MRVRLRSMTTATRSQPTARPCSARSPRSGSAATGRPTPRTSRRTAARTPAARQSAADGKAAFDDYLGKPFPLRPVRHRRRGGRRALAVRHRPRRHLPARRRRHAARRRHSRDPGLARGRAGRPGRARPRDPAPDQRAQPRDGAGRHAHVRPGLRDGVPGRRPARAGPRPRGDRLLLRRDDPARRERHLGEAAGQAAAAADDQDVHGRAARRRAGRSAATPSRPGTPTPACSPAWSPATRSS